MDPVKGRCSDFLFLLLVTIKAGFIRNFQGYEGLNTRLGQDRGCCCRRKNSMVAHNLKITGHRQAAKEHGFSYVVKKITEKDFNLVYN